VHATSLSSASPGRPAPRVVPCLFVPGQHLGERAGVRPLGVPARRGLPEHGLGARQRVVRRVLHHPGRHIRVPVRGAAVRGARDGLPRVGELHLRQRRRLVRPVVHPVLLPHLPRRGLLAAGRRLLARVARQPRAGGQSTLLRERRGSCWVSELLTGPQLPRGRERRDALLDAGRRWRRRVLAVAASFGGILGAGEPRGTFRVVFTPRVAGMHGGVTRATGFRRGGQETAVHGQEAAVGGGRPRGH
jgi:hypothetical protein